MLLGLLPAGLRSGAPAPAFVSVTPTGASGELALAWAGVTTTAYDLLRGTDSDWLNAAVLGPYNLTGLTLTGLSDGVEYFLWARVSPDGDLAGPVRAIPYQRPDPPLISALAPLAGQNALALSWTAATPHGYPLAAYRVELDKGTGSFGLEKLLSAAASTASAAAPCGLTLKARVVALDAAGNSGYSAVALASIPCPPLITSTAAVPGLLSIGHNLLPSLAAAQVTAVHFAYALTPSASSYPNQVAPLASPHALTQLAQAQGESRWYRAYAIDSAGATSAASLETAFLPPPDSVQVTPSKGSVHLRWASTQGALSPVSCYVVQYFPPSGTAMSVTITAPASGQFAQVTLGALSDGMPYAISLAAATGDAGFFLGTWLNLGTAMPGHPHPAITRIRQSQAGLLSISWTAANLGADSLAQYRVYRASDPALTTAALAATSTALGALVALTGSVGSTDYYFIAVSGASGALSSLTPPASLVAQVPNLPAPAALAAVSANSRVYLSWSGVAQATEYQLYRALSLTQTPLPVGPPVMGLNAVDTTPFNGQANYYRVSARRVFSPGNSEVEGPLSAPATVSPSVPPGRPGRNLSHLGEELFYLTATAQLSASVSQTALALSWAPALAGSTPLAGFRIYRGPSLDSLAQFGPALLTSTSHTDTGLTMGFTYAYAVEAVASGPGAETGPRLTRTAIVLSPPPAPALASAQLLTSGVRVSWSVAAPAYNPISAYQVYRSFSPSHQYLPVTRTTALQYLDAAGDTSFAVRHYRVASLDNLGLTSTAFAYVSATVQSVAPSGAPPLAVEQPSAASVQGGTAALRWALRPSAEAVSAYTVYRDSLAQVTLSAAPLADSYNDTTPAWGGTYSYQVQAHNATGSGPLSPAAVLEHRPPAPPSLSQTLDLSDNPGPAVKLSWPGMGVGSGGLTGYIVYRSTDAFANNVELGGVTLTSYLDLTALDGAAYEYRVGSIADGVTSVALSPGVSYGVAGLPSSPALASARALTSGGGVQLDFSPMTGTVKAFIYRGLSPLSAYPGMAAKVMELPSGVSTATDVGLTPGIAYYYAVAGQNFSGHGAALALTYAVSPLPGPPNDFSAKAGLSQATGLPAALLDWSQPQGFSGVTQYEVFRSPSPLFSASSSLTFTALEDYQDDTAPAGTASFYWVQAVSATASALAGPLAVTVLAQAAAPAGATATASDFGVSLAWSPSPAAEAVTAYLVHYQYASGPLSAGRYVLQGSALSVTAPAAQWVTATVSALNSAGAGPAVTVAARAGMAGTAPAAVPLSFSAQSGFVESVAGLTRVQLGWVASGSPASFQLYRSTLPIPLTLAAGGKDSPLWVSGFTAGTAAATDVAVSGGTDYHYALTAVGPGGLPGAESYPAFAAPVRAYTHPGLVSVTASVAGVDRVDLAWEEPLLKGSAGGVQGYRIYRYKSFSAVAVGFKSVPADAGFPLDLSSTAFSDFGVQAGSFYSYWISVVDTAGVEAPLAAPAQSVLSPQGLRRPPRTISLIPGDAVVELRWLVEPQDTGLKYNIYRRDASGAYSGPLPYLFQVPAASSSFGGVSYVVQSLADTMALNRTPYCYALSIVNNFGEGQKSPDLCGSAFKRLQPPANAGVAAEVVNRSKVQLTWGAAQGLSSTGQGWDVGLYRVYRSQDGGATYVPLADLPHTGASTYSYTDLDTDFGFSYVYRVMPVDTQGNEGFSYFLATMTIPAAQNNVLLFRNAFNPDAGDSVPVQFSLVQPGHAWVKVYTLQGEHVATLFDEEVVSASVDAPYLSEKKAWDGRNSAGQVVASGVYLIHLEATGYRANARVAVIK